MTAAAPPPALCRRALASQPASTDAWLLLGVAVAVSPSDGGDPAAIPLLRRALVLSPDRADVAINLANACGRASERADLLSRDRRLAAAGDAVRLDPASSVCWGRLAAALVDADRAEAATTAMRALRLEPDQAAAWCNLAVARRRMGLMAAAQTAFRRALALSPDLAPAWAGLGVLRADVDAAAGAAHAGPQAHAVLDRAVRLAPDLPWPHLSRAMVRLRDGGLAEGWEEYEWRRRLAPPRPAGRPPPLSADPLSADPPVAAWRNLSVLVYAEQGIGDVLQFVRLLAPLRRIVRRTVFECPPSLRRVLRTAPGVDVFWPDDGSPPTCDGEIPLLSLPRLLRLEFDDLPGPYPYLTVEPAATERWRTRLADSDGGRRPLRVGLSWRGSGRGRRSAPLADMFAPLARIPGVRFVGLHRAADRAAWDEAAGWPIERPGDDFDAGPDAFIDTAAALTALDLLISVDTATAHLAGALGRPVWLALGDAPDWRWPGGRTETTPWYPDARLFRRSRSGGWAAVGAEMAARLAELAATPICEQPIWS
jgi:tetratricopeptide (TPR) repeat protein